MAVNITDSGSTVKIEITADYTQEGYPTIEAQTRWVEKTVLSIKAEGNQVVIFDRETKFSFLYSDVTTPSGGTAAAVAGSIEAFKDSVAPVSGDLVRGTTSDMTNTAATDVLAAPGSGLYNNITNLSIINSHASVGTWVNIKEETTGITLWTVYAAPAGGGEALAFPKDAPLRGTQANKKTYAQCETTGANVRVCLSGYKSV